MEDIMGFAKILLNKEVYKNLKKIRSNTERFEVAKNSIVSNLNLRFEHLNSKINILEEKNNDMLFVKNYFSMLSGKISYLKVHFTEHNLLKVILLIQKVEREVSNLNVRSI